MLFPETELPGTYIIEMIGGLRRMLHAPAWIPRGLPTLERGSPGGAGLRRADEVMERKGEHIG
jgi:hypothetical protein